VNARRRPQRVHVTRRRSQSGRACAASPRPLMNFASR
jgi:hypothetical protein